MKKYYFTFLRILSLMAAAVILFSNTVYSASVESIKIHQESLISGTKVLLGEISTIEGQLDAIEEIENIVLCSAPKPKKSRDISRALIISRLRKNGVLTDKVEIICPEKVVIKSDFIEFSQRDLENIIKKHIRGNVTWDQNFVEIRNILCKSVVLPKGNVSYSFSSNNDKVDFIGIFNDQITFVVDNTYKRKTRVSAKIVVVTPVAVSTRIIERNRLIKPEDIKLIPKDITNCSDHILTDLSLIIGKNAKTRINPGVMIKEKMLGSSPVVKKGDMVTIFLENEFMKLSVPGKVLERGAIGESIKVSNTSSDTDIYAVVRNSKTVEVVF